MRFIHFVINISQNSADVWKYQDSVLGHEDCLAANSKSMGPPQKSADDRNCSVDSAVRPTFAEWQNADVDGQWLLLWVYNCPSGTAEQFHGDKLTYLLTKKSHTYATTSHSAEAACKMTRGGLLSTMRHKNTMTHARKHSTGIYWAKPS